jgi:hypothetical protein
MRNASLLLHIECKLGKREEGVPVSWLLLRLSIFSFRRNRNAFDIVPGFHQNHVKSKKAGK